MQSEFKYYAATLKSKKEQYRLPVEDAVLVDSSHMTIEEVVKAIVDLCK